MAKTNVATRTPAPRNHEGVVAARINVEQQLRRSVLACMLWEDTFYEAGTDIAQRIQDLCADLLKQTNGPRTLLQLAVDARTRFKLRHVPLWLTVAMIKAGQGDPTDKKMGKHILAARAEVAEMISRVVQRPDEMGELASQYWKANGGRKMLTGQMKIGLAAALKQFDEYALAKWDTGSAGVKPRDVMFLSHAKPDNEVQAALWKRLAENQLTTPDTWEVALSGGADKKETFTRLINEKKLGAMALLRNLRNMQQAGVESKVIRTALQTMKVERVLPFRFIAAAKYAPTLEPDLEDAMFRCLEVFDKLKGKTIIAVDNSPSMYNTKISAKSDLDRIDAACALAMLVREVCEEVVVIAFSTTNTIVPTRRGFALRDAIKKTESNGTHIGAVVRRACSEGFDRLIVVTDEQSQDTVPKSPGMGIGYMLNVAPYKNGVGYGPWTHIDGWSEAVVDYMQQAEAEIPANLD